jgi:hypothetical protein
MQARADRWRDAEKHGTRCQFVRFREVALVATQYDGE